MAFAGMCQANRPPLAGVNPVGLRGAMSAMAAVMSSEMEIDPPFSILMCHEAFLSAVGP